MKGLRMGTIVFSSLAEPGRAPFSVSSHAETEIVVRLSGSADLTTVLKLNEYLEQVHAQALAQKVHSVSVDLRDLDFMNSSCLKAFVQWVAEVQEAATEDRYAIVIHGSDRRAWQKRSLHALATLAPEVVSLKMLP
jgi:anti-anti-sigma factor